MVVQLKRTGRGRTRKTLKERAVITESFDKGKNSREEDSKIRFDEFDRADNIIWDRENAIPRPGTSTLLTDEDFLDLTIGKNSAGNKLYAMKKDTLDSKLVDIDRTAFTETDKITGISGQSGFNFASGADVFYLCNGTDTDIQVVQKAGTVTTLAIPSGVPKALTLAAERLWVGDNAGALHYSQKTLGEITSFVANNAHNTGGVASTGIDDIVAIASSGIYVIVFGTDRFEVHIAPKFAGGETTFGAAPDTLVAAFDGWGLSNHKSFVVIGSYIYFMNEAGFYNYLVGSLQEPQNLDTNKGEHAELNFSSCAMAYHKLHETTYGSAIRTGQTNDYIVAYKIRSHLIRSRSEQPLNAFSNFIDVNVTAFAFDDDNQYFLQSDSGVIKEFTGTTDDGVGIDGEIVTANTNNKSNKFLKKAGHMYLDVASDGTDTVYYKFWQDTKENTNTQPVFNVPFTINVQPPALINGMGAYGLQPWGLSGYSTGTDRSREFVFQNRKINRKYARGQCGVSFTTVNNLKIRELGWFARVTNQRSGNREFK